MIFSPLLKSFYLSLIFLFFLLLGFGIGKGYIELPTLAKKNIELSDCNLETLVESVNCLQADFITWYVFNSTNTGKMLTEADLKASGGVCSHATEWYQKHLNSFGFLTQAISIYPKEPNQIGHEFLIAYDKTVDNYCLIDQRIVTCFYMGSEDG